MWNKSNGCEGKNASVECFILKYIHFRAHDVKNGVVSNIK